MKDPFFNYTVYRLPDGVPEAVQPEKERTFDHSFVIVCHHSEGLKGIEKVQQILSSINYNVGTYELAHHDTEESIIPNALSSKKVTHLLVFDHNIPQFSDRGLNEPYDLQNTSLFATYSIAAILEEEKSGQTDKRRALWTGLKNWKI